MSSPFTTLTNGVTNEQIDAMARSGRVPSNLKSEVSKTYFIIFVGSSTMWSDITGTEISGEVIICEGRENTFDRIIDYLNSDTACNIDIEKSKALVEGVDAGKGVPLRRFIELCRAKYPDKQIDLSRYLEEDGYDNEETTNRMATGFGGNSGTLLNE